MVEDLHESRALFVLQNRMDKSGCYLEISRDPEYKKPRLPFPGSTAKLHHLLRPAKIAYNWLVSVFEELPGIDLEKYRYIRELYRVEQEHECFWDDEIHQGYGWLQAGAPYPMTISGFLLRSWESHFHACSLDLSPFDVADHEADLMPLPGDLDPAIFNVCARAADAFNTCAAEIYDLGFLFFPAKFTDVIAHIYPGLPLPGGKKPFVL